jgi:hypothetical protein
VNTRLSAVVARAGTAVNLSRRRTCLVALACTAAATAAPGVAAAQTSPTPTEDAAPPRGVRWSVSLLGGALAPLRSMRDTYQDGLVAGARVELRTRLGLGVVVALDYSPLPRRQTVAETFDTTYGTAALMPAFTLGRGTVRLQLAAGGGGAFEHSTAPDDPEAGGDHVAPAALAQLALELHLSDGGGLVLAAGGTRTFGEGERAFEYGWAMAGLRLEL